MRESEIEGAAAIRATAAAGEKIAFSLAFRDTSLGTEEGEGGRRARVREVDP